MVAKHGAGTNDIDVAAAAALGIPVLAAVGANAHSVAEHALTLMLALAKDLRTQDAFVRGGGWEKKAYRGHELRGRTLGIVGIGAIGSVVARLAVPFGMKTIAYDPYVSDTVFGSHLERVASLDALLSRADIVSLHCPLTNATRNLLDERRFGLMKPSSFVVNTARGALIDEAALCAALLEGKIAGAALDSFAVEPPAKDSPLWAMPNLITTPHIAGVTAGSAKAMAEIAARHVIAVLDGEAPDEGSLARLTELAA